MSTIYRWKDGNRFQADPQAVGEAIAALGSPTAEEIVAAAKAKASPLHSLFLWDDAEAAHEQRLDIARLIGRTLTITVRIIDGPMDKVTVRAFEAVKTGAGPARQYMPVMEVMSREEWADQVYARFAGEAEALKRDAEAYLYLGGRITKAVKHLKHAIRALATP